ncbi:MAG: flagellar biosynthesis protein FlhF [Chlamydiia bacterium]|nr:flagellar biosynthesis protein FlhF [Chlamydiia bacterium]
MIIKKFIANTEDEALAAVRRELGPEAVIVSRRTLRPTGLKALFASSKIEVTAAADGPGQRSDPGRAKQREEELASNLQRLKATFAEQPPAPVNSEDKVSLSPQARQRMKAEAPAPAPSPRPNPEAEMKRAADGLLQRFAKEVPAQSPVVSEPEPSAAAPDIRQMIREEVERAQKGVSVGPLHANDEELTGSVRFLMAKGVSRSIALEIEDTLQERFGPVDLKVDSPLRRKRLQTMKELLADKLQCTGPFRLKKGQATVVALVGPHGVGKSTTLMKLAVHYGHQLGKRVAVVSLDNSKVGAREQIRGLAESFRIPLTLAATPFELKQAVQSYGDRDLVLIDTSGRSQYDRRQVDELADLLSVVENIHSYLTVSAATKDIDVYGTVQQFAPIGVEGLIVTKLDETIAYGMMLNVCHHCQQSIAYVAAGPRIPEDLKLADAQDIARSIMVQHNNQEFQSLRSLVS